MPEAIAYTEHAVDVLARAVEVIDAGQRLVLITSVDILGGAAREVGSLAVVEADGRMTGYMSNGCIDRDIQIQAQILLSEGKPARLLRYGEGSPFLDLTLPCGGALELLLDPAPSAQALRQALGALRARQPATLEFHPPETEAPCAFIYAPKPLLALAGRGAVFRATARVAHDAGFDLQLLSPDAEDLEALDSLHGARTARLTTPDAAPPLALDPCSAFLTLFHDHDWEPALLCAALETQARFIGSLGSRRTHAARLERLRLMGCSDAELDRLRGPIGLVPSLRQAPLIAVSAIAEVVAEFPVSVRRQGQAEPGRQGVPGGSAPSNIPSQIPVAATTAVLPGSP